MVIVEICGATTQEPQPCFLFHRKASVDDCLYFEVDTFVFSHFFHLCQRKGVKHGKILPRRDRIFWVIFDSIFLFNLFNVSLFLFQFPGKTFSVESNDVISLTQRCVLVKICQKNKKQNSAICPGSNPLPCHFLLFVGYLGNREV